MSNQEILDALLAEEARLTFASFDDQTAWELGSAMRESARAAGLPVAISIRRNGQRLFHAALPGASADNDAWLDRKCAVVDRYGHSSYYVGSQFRAAGGDFDVAARLDVNRYAAHGGAFPLLIAGTGCVGTIAVSGLPQLADHEFVTTQLDAFLGLLDQDR
jgi:uncharacterized protein (UPF0303 family)